MGPDVKEKDPSETITILGPGKEKPCPVCSDSGKVEQK